MTEVIKKYHLTAESIYNWDKKGFMIGQSSVRKRNHKKRLNLLGKETNGDPQFFSPQKVLAARAYQETKETAEEEKRHQKAL